MDKHVYDEVMATFASNRLIASEYRYYKDRYSLQLLHAALPANGQARSVADLKRGPLARLFDKPRVAEPVRRHCGRPLTRAIVEQGDHDRDPVAYHLGFSTWGREGRRAAQTSRRGINLVVQLNFDRAHDADYEWLIKPKRGKVPFGLRGHPDSWSRNTMAWARVDIDLDAAEALIEEVQTDWLRGAGWAASRGERVLASATKGQSPAFHVWGMRGSARQSVRYYERHIVRHNALWSEAMLSATLQVLVNVLRVRRVFHHSLRSGLELRALRRWEPPRSIYTDLPRKFCFAETTALPAFLEREPEVCDLRRQGGLPSLYLLEL